MVQSNQGHKRAEILKELNEVSDQVSRTLLNPRFCQATLGSLISSAQSIAAMSSPNGLPVSNLNLPLPGGSSREIAAVNQAYGQLRIENMNLRIVGTLGSANVNNLPHTSYKAELRVNFSNTSSDMWGSTGSRTKTIPLMITVANGTGALAGCYEERQSTNLTEAACQNLGGQMRADVQGGTPRCTALDATQTRLVSTIEQRIQSVSSTSRQISTAINRIASDMASTHSSLTQSLNVEVNRLTDFASRLDQTIQNLTTTRQNLANTNRNLASTNQNLVDLNGQMARDANRISSQIDALEARLNQQRTDLNNQVSQLNAQLTNINKMLDQINAIDREMRELGQSIANFDSRIANTRTQLFVVRDQILRETTDVEILRQQIEVNLVTARSLEWTLQQADPCRLGRNQYGNCVEPYQAAPVPTPSCPYGSGPDGIGGCQEWAPGPG